jgi:glucokinase
MPYALGFDLGGTNIKAVAVTPEGELLERASDATDDAGDGWPVPVRNIVSRLESSLGESARWIGVASPGLAAPDDSRITWMQGRMESVQGVSWTEFFGSDRPVPVINDAHAALLGEVWLGAAAGFRNAILLTLGTGVGGGILAEGKLLKGRIGRAGHLGHISLDPDGPMDIVGTPGSLELEIGDCTIRERTKGRFNATEDLVKAHLEEDAEASEVWLRSVRSLAAGIASLANVLDPEAVILGGGITKAGDALFGPLRTYLDEWEWRPTGEKIALLPAMLGEWAGAFGAAYRAVNREG